MTQQFSHCPSYSIWVAPVQMYWSKIHSCNNKLLTTPRRDRVAKHSSAYSEVNHVSMTCSAMLSLICSSNKSILHHDIVHWCKLTLISHFHQHADSVIMHCACGSSVLNMSLSTNTRLGFAGFMFNKDDLWFMPCRTMTHSEFTGPWHTWWYPFQNVDCFPQRRFELCGWLTISEVLTTRVGGENWVAVVKQTEPR